MSEFDQFRDSYSAQIDGALRLSGKSHDYFTRVKAQYLIDLLERAMPVAGKVRLLDVGCGHGLIHPFLLAGRLPLEIVGVEVATSVIDVARADNPTVSYDVYEGEVLPYEDASFDAAVTITVMHHVPPPQWPSFVAEMKRVVRPGGIVVVFEHNPYNPVTARIVRTCPIDENAVLLPSRKLTGLMRDAGLSEVDARFILLTPFEAAPFAHAERLASRLPLGAQYYAAGRVPVG